MRIGDNSTTLSKRLVVLGPWISNKAVLASAAILILVFFGDTLLPWLGHLAFLLLEFVEVNLDRLLERAFGLSPRRAQMVIAWSAFALLVYFSVRTIKKIHHYCRYELLGLILRQYAELQASPWPAWLTHPWAKVLLLVGALGFSFFLFS